MCPKINISRSATIFWVKIGDWTYKISAFRLQNLYEHIQWMGKNWKKCVKLILLMEKNHKSTKLEQTKMYRSTAYCNIHITLLLYEGQVCIGVLQLLLFSWFCFCCCFLGFVLFVFFVFGLLLIFFSFFKIKLIFIYLFNFYKNGAMSCSPLPV